MPLPEKARRGLVPVRGGDPGSPRVTRAPDTAHLADLLALADALDAALARRGGLERAVLAEVRDTVGDHLVALSAAGASAAERMAVSSSLTSVLAEATERLRAVRAGLHLVPVETPDVRRSAS
jgi:enoyl-CoA hydratase/carnithine racemase